MSEEKKQLNEQDLDKVSGGHFRDRYLPADKGEHIYADDAKDHIDEMIYFVCDRDREVFGWGKLLASYYTVITGTMTGQAPGLYHDIYVEGRNDYPDCCDIPLNANYTISAGSWTLFKKNGQ